MERKTSILLILSAIFFPIPLYVYMKKLRRGLIVSVISFVLTIIPGNLALTLLIPVDYIIGITIVGVGAGLGLSFYYPFRLLFQRWNKEKLGDAN